MFTALPSTPSTRVPRSSPAPRDTLADGPFHTALREAIATRGLTLTRLHDRLRAAGHTVGVSTLSNWQRGTSRPRGPQSALAVAELEQLLGLPAGTLARLLEEPAGRSRRADAIPGTPARRLRTELHPEGDTGLAALAVHHDVTVHPGGWEAAIRVVVRSHRTGADRHVVLAHTSGSGAPTVRAGRDCRLGRVRADHAQSLIAAEILVPPLNRGETFALEYHTAGRGTESYCGHWLRSPGQRYDLTVRLAPELGARRAYRVWRLDSRAPHKDLAQLRLVGGRLAHLLDPDVPPGFHGIRWTA